MTMTVAPGTRLGPYEVVSLIGAGGMGEVYRAKDTRLQRDVAVKVLPVSFAAEPDRHRRFEQEARAAGMLNHPNILAVHDIGTHEGAPYVVSELLEGQTLRQRIDGSPMPPRKAIELAAQIARGLAAAHEKGIVHRDLKPDNLFVTREGRVKILDFGLAKVAAPALATAGTAMLAETVAAAVGVPNTEAGMVLGTASYMSPEQIRALPADHRSDIFSFGLVLYEMLTGRQAFRADSAVETMSAILKADPPRMADHVTELPPALERIVLHCLEKSPDERFQSARDIAFDLESISGSSATRALAAPAQRSKLWKRAAAAGALLTAGALGYLAAWANAPIHQPTFEPLTFRRGSATYARFAPDGRAVVYTGTWDGTPPTLYTAQPGNPESRSLDIRGNLRSVSRTGEILVSMPRPGRPAMLGRLPLGGGAPRDVVQNIRDASWGPNGEDIAIVRIENGRHRIEFPIGHVLYETGGWISSLRVSPAGDRIAFADHPLLNDSRGGVSVVDLQGKKTAIAAGFEDVGQVAWPPGGQEVWFSAAKGASAIDHSLFAAGLNGKTRLLLTGPGHMALQDVSAEGDVLISHGARRAAIGVRAPGAADETELAWMDYSILKDLSADGRQILFSEQGAGGGAGYAAYLRSTDGAPAVRLGKGDPHSISNDGLWVLAADLATNTLNLLPTGAGQPRAITNHGMTQYPWSGFLPGDRTVLFHGTDKAGVNRMYVQDLEGGQPRAVTPEGVTVSRNTSTPDGKWLAATQQDTVRLFPLEGGEPRPVNGSAAGDVPIRWNADGSVLYVAVSDPPGMRVFALNVATGTRTLLHELAVRDRVGTGNIQGVWISADGRSYSYTYFRALQSVYVIKNLR